MSGKRLSIISIDQDSAEVLSLRHTVEFSGMHAEMVLEFVRAGLVQPLSEDEGGEPRFSEHEALRLRQIESLRQQRRVDLHTICDIVRLLDRLESAEAELRRLRERLR